MKNRMLLSIWLLVSCSLAGGQTGLRKPSETLDNEAVAEFRKMFERHFTQCSRPETKLKSKASEDYPSYYAEVTYESYTGSGYNGPPPTKGKGIVRLSRVTFKPVSRYLGEADRRNGLQWTGDVTLVYLVGRVYTREKGWGEWQDNVRFTGYTLISKSTPFSATKRDSSGWKVDRTTLDFKYDDPTGFAMETYRKIGCADIPE